MEQQIETLPATVPAQNGRVSAEDFLPLLSVEQAVQRKDMINAFIGRVLVESVDGNGDYGAIPGAGKKKVLLKAGAEKLCSIFGMAPTYEPAQVIEDWTGAAHAGEPLFYYEYRCQLSRGGRFMGEAIGSANSWETKHRYRWLREDQIPPGLDKATLPVRGGKQTLFAYEFAINKAETTGQYGKAAEYWQGFKDASEAGIARRVNKPFKSGKEGWGWEYDINAVLYRIPNPEAPDLVNTLQKMAQKRALVAAVLVVTNCSDSFTQDLEDIELPAPSTAPAEQVASQPHPAPAAATPPPATQAPADTRPIPDELLDTFEMLAQHPDAKSCGSAALHMEKLMVGRAGDKGLDAYNAVTKAYRRVTPKGKDTVPGVKKMLLDLWEVHQKLPIAETEAL
jgi:hypothetical protein